MKLNTVYNIIITESVSGGMMGNLEINGDMVTLYHYSDKLFTTISVSAPGNIRTPSTARGVSQIWLYCHKDGNGKDATVPRDYLYIVTVPLSDLYDMSINPEELFGDNRYQTVSNVKKAGYNGMYSTIYDGEIPIVNYFKNLKPIKIFKQIGNGYEEIDLEKENKKDIIVGEYNSNRILADVSKEPSLDGFYLLDYFGNKTPVTSDIIKQSTVKSSGTDYSDLFLAIKYNRV